MLFVFVLFFLWFVVVFVVAVCNISNYKRLSAALSSEICHLGWLKKANKPHIPHICYDKAVILCKYKKYP